MAAACYLIGQRYYPIPYRVLTDITYIACTALLVLLVSRVDFKAQELNSVFHFVVIAVYLTIIYFIERKYFRRPAK